MGLMAVTGRAHPEVLGGGGGERGLPDGEGLGVERVAGAVVVDVELEVIEPGPGGEAGEPEPVHGELVTGREVGEHLEEHGPVAVLVALDRGVHLAGRTPAQGHGGDGGIPGHGVAGGDPDPDVLGGPDGGDAAGVGDGDERWRR